jgi:hypothetical protein
MLEYTQIEVVCRGQEMIEDLCLDHFIGLPKFFVLVVWGTLWMSIELLLYNLMIKFNQL